MAFSRRGSVAAALVAAATAALSTVGGGVAQANVNIPFIQQGTANNAQTTCVQQAIRIRFPMTIDGLWGPKTTEGVVKYQKAFGFKPDGIVGKVTGSAMASDISYFDQSHKTTYYKHCYDILPTNY